MAMRHSLLLAVWLVGGASAWAQHGALAPKASQYGTIAGTVTNSRGIAQAGVPVTVTRRDGLSLQYVQKIYTGLNGRFDLSRLLPGLYAVEVNLPNFLPFSKAPVSVRPGAEVLIDVSLRSLAESMEIGMPQDPAGAREDWKWTLRTGTPTRPILRFQDESERSQKAEVSTPRERPLRGAVLVAAGNESRSFGADPRLRTVFDVAYGWTGSNELELAGSAGMERGTPAASMRAAWNHRSDDGGNSSFSVTARQLFLSTGYREEFRLSGIPFGRRIQSMSGAYRGEKPLSNHLSFRYGTIFDSLTLRRRMSQWSPSGQLIYSPSEQTRWTFAYTAETPRLLPSGPGADPSQVEQWLAIPQVSSDVTGGMRHTVLEEGQHLEAAWERKLGARYQFQAAAFYDSLSDVALSISAADTILFPAGLLKDPFSDTHFLDGGHYSSAGARATVATRLWDNSELVFSYSYAGGLQAVSGNLTPESSQSLQAMLRTQREHSFVVKLRSTLPRTRTQVITSYRWLPRDAIMPGDPYDNGLGLSEPYLNVSLVQPLPSYDIIPVHFQAIADFNNLLAQGYLPVHGPDGSKSYIFPSARSFRGGFSFVF